MRYVTKHQQHLSSPLRTPHTPGFPRASHAPRSSQFVHLPSIEFPQRIQLHRFLFLQVSRMRLFPSSTHFFDAIPRHQERLMAVDGSCYIVGDHWEEIFALR